MKRAETQCLVSCPLWTICCIQITRSIWKMLGPFARAVLHCHSPGVATVARRLHIDVHDDDDDNNDNAWQREPLWPHRMGPITHCCSCSAFGPVEYIWQICVNNVYAYFGLIQLVQCRPSRNLRTVQQRSLNFAKLAISNEMWRESRIIKYRLYQSL